MSEDYRITTENKVKTEMEILGNVFSAVRLLSEDEVGARTKNCESKRVVGIVSRCGTDVRLVATV